MCWWHPITILMTTDIKKKWIGKKKRYWQIVSRRLIRGTVAQERPKTGRLYAT